MSLHRPTLRAIAALLLVSGTFPEGNVRGGELPTPETIAPAGDYRIAWLRLEKCWEKGADLMMFLGLRSGQGAAVWYCAPDRSDCHHLWPDENTVKLAGGALTGQIGGRMVKQWAPIAEVGAYTIRLDAKVDDGKVTGAYSAVFAEKPVSGQLSGTVAGEEELKKTHGLPAGKDWPGYYGVGFAFCGPECGAEMIEDLNAARPLWKAEEPLPCMWGRGPEDRYKHRACVVGCAGGASSPVVAGGLVYCYYYRPTGPLTEGPRPWDQARPLLRTEQEMLEHAAKTTKNPTAQKALLDWHRPYADDIVVAIDGATGKVMWKTVLKDRSGNFQAHKWRGYNPTPFVAAGVLYVQGYGNRLYALAAATGKLLWEYGGLAVKRDHGVGRPAPGAAGPLVADGVVVMAAGDTLAGLDPKSGSELWKGVGGNLLVWSKGGRERMVTYGGHGQVTVSCVDPKTGNVCWKADTPYTTSAGTVVHPVLSQDMLVGFEVKVTANVSAEAKVVCYRLGDNGMEQAWSAPAPVPMTDTYGLTIANGHVYVDGERETSCLRLADGQKVASVAGVGGARTQVAFYADGRLFIQPEGRHGGQSFFMLNADPGSFRRLGADTPAGGKHPLAGQWHPPHPHDTAYANQPVSYPVVDGRIFIRGHDGLYCYDLRKQAK